MPVVFQIRLESDGSPSTSKKYARLPPPVAANPYLLRFVILAGSNAETEDTVIVTNIPAEGKPFSRSLQRELKFTRNNQLADSICEVSVVQAGVFEYFVKYGDSLGEIGAVVVDPLLLLPSKNLAKSDKDCLLPLDGICVLTVIPKWMPFVSKWPAFFESFSQAGYNMIHFAPVNTRGASNSPYSIFDQLSLSFDLFGHDKHLDEKIREKELGETLKLGHSKYGIMSITDVVWNHTAHDSEWLQLHPEAGYNLQTAPHLRVAFELDEAIMGLYRELAEASIPLDLKTEDHLSQIMKFFIKTTIPTLRLWEFYVVNVAVEVDEFKKEWVALKNASPTVDETVRALGLNEWTTILRRNGLPDVIHLDTRFNKKIQLSAAIDLLQKLFNLDEPIDSVTHMYTDILDKLNAQYYKESDEDISVIISNVWNRARYLRLDPQGPQLGPISEDDPFVDTYFTRLPLTVATHKLHPDARCLASNGWIWNGNPLKNFAGPDSKAYLHREVIAWGDCVKLRYGDGPKSNPWLWEHQKKYTEKMARLFHGFRIDNCHSTPIHVATYLLDAARCINPNLYVFAELFTGSEETDVLFVKKLGINSLIREAMSAWDVKELSRLVHRFGGTPVGSLTSKMESFPLEMLGHQLDSSFYSPVPASETLVVDVKGSTTHALFMDCTHDNETPHQKRTAEDTLSTAALVAMTSSAIGSVNGFDVIVPELLNVVTETRQYRICEPHEGIIPAKSILLNIHSKMAREGYTEIHVNHSHDYISVHRTHPITHDGYLLIARCAFSKYPDNEVHPPIALQNQAVNVVVSASLRVQTIPLSPPFDDFVSPHGPHGPHDSAAIAFARDERARIQGRKTIGSITGLPCFLDFSPILTTIVDEREEPFGSGIQTVLTVKENTFSPGSIVLYRTWMTESGMNLVVPDVDMSPMPSPMRMAMKFTNEPRGLTPEPELQLKKLVSRPKSANDKIKITNSDPGNLEFLWQLMGVDDRNRGAEIMIQMGNDVLDSGILALNADNLGKWPPGLWQIVNNLDLEAINIIMYRCASEEQDSIGDGVYDIPSYGPLPYCGLQGFMSVIQYVARNNDLGHAMCANLRSGTWMMDYVVSRLRKYGASNAAVLKLGEWFAERFDLAKDISSAFQPKYFFQTIFLAYHTVKYGILCNLNKSALSTFIHPKSSFENTSSLKILSQSLSLTSLQLFSRVATTSLFPPGKYPQAPFDNPNGLSSLAAGLPHFASHHMRCWGRDIFIALRGLFLIPGHYSAARDHLIAFGSTLRHGLIPNLLDQGIFPRYNARDAAWWWLWSVQQYCKMAPEGNSFLSFQVKRRFPPLQRYRSGEPTYLIVDESADGDEGDAFTSIDDSRTYKYSSTIGEICHEILERHARGIDFREWNAGSNLDHAMTDIGFQVTCGTRFEDGSGLVFGGSKFNCGTWMDKMGDSEKAGTQGTPATPRDGADVEIIGLVKATLKWIVDDLSNAEGLFPGSGVYVKGTQRSG
ncbi:hypothetical protein HK100_000768 [Physocladia obscura]|uniref:Uncharacterized protein n=1 Tax=Physocladia obscura TaxID=109957 RepID=A0AAD5XGP6_9FUNG|nr:hypothetical protein HK100_000768 [Physocladia obscura]